MEESTAAKNGISESDVRRLISANLKRLRAIQKLTQSEIARMTGLSDTFINDIENCKKGISDKTIAKFSKALDVEPYQFFLPENMPDDKTRVFIGDLNNSFEKAMRDLTRHYLGKE